MSYKFDIQYCTTSDAELFTRVIRLRYEAYKANNRLTWQRSWKDMHDEQDERSIIVVASVNNKVCGSLRVTTSHEGDILSYPKPNIPLNQYVESSRLCINPCARGKGLWYLLAAHMVIVGHKTERGFIIGSAMDELVPTWSKIGFKKAGYRYFNNDINGADHELMMLDIVRVLKGECDPKFYSVLQQELQKSIHNS